MTLDTFRAIWSAFWRRETLEAEPQAAPPANLLNPLSVRRLFFSKDTLPFLDPDPPASGPLLVRLFASIDSLPPTRNHPGPGRSPQPPESRK